MNVHWNRNSLRAGVLLVLCFCCVSQHLQCLTHIDAQLIFLNERLNEWDVLPKKLLTQSSRAFSGCPWWKSYLPLTSGTDTDGNKNMCSMRIPAVCWYSAFRLIPIIFFTLVILFLKCADGCTHILTSAKSGITLDTMIFILFQGLFQALMPLQLLGRWE